MLIIQSCKNDYKSILEINKYSKIPSSVTENFKLVYTDSSVIKAILNSPLNVDYTNQAFPYAEFPQGLNIMFYEKNNNTTNVSANYGIVYYKTKIVSLKGDVLIQSADGSKIKSSQIYWDPEQEWLFTEKDINFSSDEYEISANKLDADRSFKLLKTGQLNGNFLFDDN
tara:strand:+ start:352 stop:858 length:507 start_codon:yes stop_codon:yes gene_type:complete